MSDFAALNTALSGLVAHRRASEVIGNNVANVNTEGYARQRPELQAAGGGAVPAMFARPRQGGDGVVVTGITRIVDNFLERRYLAESATGGSLRRTSELLGRIELTFPEPGDNGLAQQLSEFWAGWEDVANNPTSLGARSQLLERAQTVVQAFNRGAADLGALRRSALDQLEAFTTEVNDLTARIADLNNAVRNAVNARLSPNDLIDQRDVLVSRLASLVGVTVRDGESGSIDVSIGGTAVVRGDRSERLALTIPVTPAGPVLDAVGWERVGLRWEKDGYPVDLQSGEMHGLVQAVNDVLPRYLDRLNGAARHLATEVNAGHQNGFDRDGNPGLAMFGYTGGGAPLPTEPPLGWAAKLQLLLTDPRSIAAASDATALNDGKNAQAIAGGARLVDQSYREMIGQLGVETQNVNRRKQIQDQLTLQVDTERKSVKGVNLDEEMVNLMQAQQAYHASARLMTAIDEMLDTLIRSTGVVGR